MFLQYLGFARDVCALIQLTLPSVVKQWQFLDWFCDERQHVETAWILYHTLLLLYLFPDIVSEFLCFAVLFVGQIRCHFGQPYCTSALLAHNNLLFGHMLEKKICTLYAGWSTTNQMSNRVGVGCLGNQPTIGALT